MDFFENFKIFEAKDKTSNAMMIFAFAVICSFVIGWPSIVLVNWVERRALLFGLCVGYVLSGMGLIAMNVTNGSVCVNFLFSMIFNRCI